MRTFLAVLTMLLGGSVSPPQSQVGARTQGIETFHVTGHFVHRGQRMPVPFELIHNVIVFKVNINGHPAWAQLDNGSWDSALDVNFAKSISLPLGSPVAPLHTPTGGMIERGRVQDVEVDIPGQATFQGPLSAVDLSFSSKFLGLPMSMIFGRVYFGGLAFLIDLDHKAFQIAPSGWLQVPSGVPYIVLNNALPQLDIKVNGKPAVVTLDMGYNGDLSLSEAAWHRLRLDQLPGFQGKSARIEGRAVSERGTIVQTVSLGPVEVHHVDARMQPIPAQDGDGTVGFGLLSRFNFAVDIGARRIWLISKAGSNDQRLKADALRYVNQATVR